MKVLIVSTYYDGPVEGFSDDEEVIYYFVYGDTQDDHRIFWFWPLDLPTLERLSASVHKLSSQFVNDGVINEIVEEFRVLYSYSEAPVPTLTMSEEDMDWTNYKEIW